MGNCCCGASATELDEDGRPIVDMATLRGSKVAVHGACGTTAAGVVAYSNGNSNYWTNEKHHLDGHFMGYKWQCVEFARRHLYMTQGLLLPSRLCAYCFANERYVHRPEQVVDATGKTIVKMQKVPVKFHKQGSRTPPRQGDLIVYPISRGSPWGHIGVIADVDIPNHVAYVADQNRFFHDWGSRGYSAAFRLDVVKGRYYIRDHESECSGWLTTVVGE